MKAQAEGLTFPCEFPIKAMGRHSETLVSAVLAVVQTHAPDASRERVNTQPSRNGSYLSVTVTVTAKSLEQLNAIYADLQGHDEVLATL